MGNFKIQPEKVGKSFLQTLAIILEMGYT